MARLHDLLLLRDPAAPEVVVARLEEDGDRRRVVAVGDRRIEEDLDGRLLLLRRVGRVAVPDDRRRREFLDLLHDHPERLPLRVRVGHHAEVRARVRAERREGVRRRDDRLAELRVVDVLVVDERRRDRAVPVFRRGLQVLQPHLQRRDVDRHEAVAAGLDEGRVLERGIVRILDDALGKPRDLPRHAHRRLARRLQVREADRQRRALRAEERIRRRGRRRLLRRDADRRRDRARAGQEPPATQ